MVFKKILILIACIDFACRCKVHPSFLLLQKKMFNDDDYHIEKFVKGGYGHKPKEDFLDSKTDKVENIDFYGFKCNDDLSLKTYLFAKLTFQSYTAMQKYIEAIREVYSHLHRRYIDGTLDTVSKIHKEWFLLDKYEHCDSNLYESNIHPVIRFIHLQKISPCGWIQINNEKDDDSTKTSEDVNNKDLDDNPNEPNKD